MATLEGADPTFAANVQAMIAASGGRLYLRSGVRNKAHQTRLWNAALAKYGSAAKARKWVAPPGRSFHEKGLAVDFGGDLKWAQANAHRWGLHQALGNEPWHYEPIGSRKGAKVPPSSTYGQLQRRHTAATTAASAAPPAPTTSTVGAESPAPPEDRKDIGVQLTSLLNILDKPIDFDGATSGTAA